jgi:two-component system chemotaxis response regulator CheY
MADRTDVNNNKKFRCIIADDSAFARQRIAGILENVGGRVVGEATNGLEAIELYAKHWPDLVLLDITMPQLDGVEALRRIVDLDKSAKVIIVSSIGNSAMVWKALCLGAKSFVGKPYNQDYAGMIISDVVAGRMGGVK